MNIGAIAQASGLSAKTIRYYEQIGLVVPRRRANGYRHYDDQDLRCLVLIRRARRMGFDLAECRRLLGLYQNPRRRRAAVKELVYQHLQAVDEKLRELQVLRDDLAGLEQECAGGASPHCPILDTLSASPATA